MSLSLSLAQLHRRLLDLLTPRYGEGEAAAMARIFIEDSLGHDRAAVLADRKVELSPEAQQTLEAQIQRLGAGEPLQYVTGRARFGPHDFAISPAVLIPRPETEELVDWAWELVSGSVSRVLDCGTGSGCIAISLALRLPLAEVHAWDISPEALSLAQQNAQQLGARLHCHERDLLAEAQRASSPQYHLIVSNPPYIPLSEAATLSPHVLHHEPHLALFVPDTDPLCFYRALAQLALQQLHPEGALLVETHRDHCLATAQLFADMGLREVEYRHDCFDQPRFVKALR